MKCDKIRQMMSIYLDGELDGKDREILLSHTKDCSVCRNSLESGAKIKKLFDLRRKTNAPLNFEYRVMERVNEISMKAEPAPIFFGLRRIACVMAVLVLLVIGFNQTKRDKIIRSTEVTVTDLLSDENSNSEMEIELSGIYFDQSNE